VSAPGQERFLGIALGDPLVRGALDRAPSLGLDDWWLTARCGARVRAVRVRRPLAMVVRPNRRIAPAHVYEAKAARRKAHWPELTVLPWDDGS
jgi:hypothetical protein